MLPGSKCRKLSTNNPAIGRTNSAMKIAAAGK
jgi:hypothetical protein